MRLPHALHKIGPWFGAVLSGVLMTLCFAPWNQPQWVWIALLPLLAALWNLPEGTAPKVPFLLGYTSGLVFFTGTFYWLHELAPLFETPALRGLPLLLAAYLALYPATWAWALARPPAPAQSPGRTSLRNVGFALRAASLWVVLDFLRGRLFTGFGWNSPGIALHQNLGLIQIADLFGVYGISFLVVLTNLTLALASRRLKHEASIRALPNLRGEIMTLLVLVGMAVSYGVRVVLDRRPAENNNLRALLVQPNTEQAEKFDPDREQAVLQSLDKLMELAAAAQSTPPHLVFWPESAMPGSLFSDEPSHTFVQKQVTRLKAPLLLGSLEPGLSQNQKGEPIAEPLAYNSAVLVGDPATPLQSYRKRHLVPFGEFLPFRDFLPGAIRALVPGDLAPGEAPNLLHLSKPSARLGALVCFEDSLSEETRDLAKEGAQILVNLTNDAWFGLSAAAEQHLANARFRAVETRLPLVRCANTGMSCVVDSLGRLQQRLAPFSEGIDSVTVPFATHPRPTLYTRWGDRWLLLCAVGALGLLRARLRKNEPYPPLQSPESPAI